MHTLLLASMESIAKATPNPRSGVCIFFILDKVDPQIGG